MDSLQERLALLDGKLNEKIELLGEELYKARIAELEFTVEGLMTELATIRLRLQASQRTCEALQARLSTEDRDQMKWAEQYRVPQWTWTWEDQPFMQPNTIQRYDPWPYYNTTVATESGTTTVTFTSPPAA